MYSPIHQQYAAKVVVAMPWCFYRVTRFIHVRILQSLFAGLPRLQTGHLEVPFEYIWVWVYAQYCPFPITRWGQTFAIALVPSLGRPSLLPLFVVLVTRSAVRSRLRPRSRPDPDP